MLMKLGVAVALSLAMGQAGAGLISRGGGMIYDDVLKITVYVTDLADFPVLNRICEERLLRPYPARATVQAAALPLGASVEIEAIARARS